MEINTYNSLVSYTLNRMKVYGVPYPYHSPEEFINQAYLSVNFADEVAIKKFIKHALLATHARICQNTLMGHYHKICTKCLESKTSLHFRVRYKFGGLDETHWYHNSTCQTCEMLEARSYYDSLKDNEDFKIKCRQWSKNYQAANRELVNIKAKMRRNKDESKQRRKEYNAENRTKIQQQHRALQLRQREQLADG